MIRAGWIFGLATIAGAASAQTMNADTFYKRAVALQNKGALAILSTDEIKALMTEGEAAGKRATERRRVAVAAGRKPRFCPPEKPSVSSGDVMNGLAAIPAKVRARIDMTEAMTRILASKYPCRR